MIRHLTDGAPSDLSAPPGGASVSPIYEAVLRNYANSARFAAVR